MLTSLTVHFFMVSYLIFNFFSLFLRHSSKFHSCKTKIINFIVFWWGVYKYFVFLRNRVKRKKIHNIQLQLYDISFANFIPFSLKKDKNKIIHLHDLFPILLFLFLLSFILSVK